MVVGLPMLCHPSEKKYVKYFVFSLYMVIHSIYDTSYILNNCLFIRHDQKGSKHITHVENYKNEQLRNSGIFYFAKQ